MSSIGSSIGKQVARDPLSLIGIVVGIQILTSLATTTFPDILTGLVALATLDNFSFTEFFESGGVLQLIVSVIVLLAIFGTMGLRGLGSSKR